MAENNQSPIARIGKAQYAQQINVSMNQLRIMLNKEFYSELIKQGYKKEQKHLTKKQIEVIEYLAVNINLSENEESV